MKPLNTRFVVLTVIIGAAAMARLLPHPPNVTPIAAIALFGGACFQSRWAAFLVPLAAMMLSDVVLGLTRYQAYSLFPLQAVVYACFAAETALGRLIANRRSVLRIGSTALAGSLLFFVVTNFAVWAGGRMYPLTGAGLIECYTAAIPFFRNTLLGDAACVTILFGGLALLENRAAWMREPALARA